MSSSRSHAQAPHRGYQQEYVVRIRYNNSLPGPLCPPKLLDIPNNAANQYTDTAFGSRLARSESVNVDVDSELGMPIDVVHMPRIFEGDETLIRPVEPPARPDPKDEPLLRRPGKGGQSSHKTPVTFLRRTEYVSSEQSRSTFRSQTASALVNTQSRSKKSKIQSDPVRILEAVLKGFDVANPETADPANAKMAKDDTAARNAEHNWKKLAHPRKPGVKAEAVYPLVPDIGGHSDTGGYMVFKLNIPAIQREELPLYEAGVFQPVDVAGKNGISNEHFDFFLPKDVETAVGCKRKFDDVMDEESDTYRYNFARRYETKDSVHYTPETVPDQLAVVLDDGDGQTGDGEKHAWFYPVLARYTIRPKRRKGEVELLMAGGTGEEEVEDLPDALRLTIRDMDEGERTRREDLRNKWEGKINAAVEGAVQEEMVKKENMESEGVGAPPDEDEDAEGEDE